MATDLLILSDRLILRPIKAEDARYVFRYRSNAGVNQFQGWIPETISDVHDFIRNKVSDKLDQADTWFQLVIVTKDKDELIGDVGIHFLKSDSNRVEIGCTLDLNHQGKGFAAEALTEAISFLFYKLNKLQVVASIDPRNEKSIRMVERIGFQRQVDGKENIFFNQEWPDDLVYLIEKDEWGKN